MCCAVRWPRVRWLAVHESEQPAGMTPNAPHTIQHTEVTVVLEGTVAFEHDGKSEKVGPGGVIFVASGTLHTVRNVGDGHGEVLCGAGGWGYKEIDSVMGVLP